MERGLTVSSGRPATGQVKRAAAVRPAHTAPAGRAGSRTARPTHTPPWDQPTRKDRPGGCSPGLAPSARQPPPAGRSPRTAALRKRPQLRGPEPHVDLKAPRQRHGRRTAPPGQRSAAPRQRAPHTCSLTLPALPSGATHHSAARSKILAQPSTSPTIHCRQQFQPGCKQRVTSRRRAAGADRNRPASRDQPIPRLRQAKTVGEPPAGGPPRPAPATNRCHLLLRPRGRSIRSGSPPARPAARGPV